MQAIWHGLADKLGRFIRSRVSDPATAQDIRQDVFVKIQRRLGEIEDPAKLGGWLYQAARNAIIDHYRTRKDTIEIPATLPAEAGSDADEVEQLKAAFRRMIYSLPEPYWEGIVVTEFEGLTQQQRADRVGISLSGAKCRVQRGRARLRQMLDECCSFEFDRRGRVIECAPREGGGCSECAQGASAHAGEHSIFKGSDLSSGEENAKKQVDILR